jgi:hypothetical protein
MVLELGRGNDRVELGLLSEVRDVELPARDLFHVG